MNILCIVRCWPSLFEVNIFREMLWLKHRGHQVAVVSLGMEEFGHHVDLAGSGIERIPVLKLDSKQFSTDQMAAEIVSFALQMGTQLFDAHFAHKPAEVALQAHLASRIPFIVRMRGGDVHSKTSPMLAQIAKHAAAICPPSSYLADVLVGRRRLKEGPAGIPLDVSSSRLRVLPYSLPAAYLAKSPAEQNENIQIIGSIGRVAPVKRFEDLVRAVVGLAGDFPGLRLLIIGGGEATPDLLNLANELGIGGRVEITGFKPWAEVMEIARGLHIYVQTSEMEGFCLAAIEAAFTGIPLVLSRTGIHEECVMPGLNGYLFEPGDVMALRQSLRSVLLAGAGKRREMGAATLQLVGGQFSEEAVMPRTEAILMAAISGDVLPH